MGAHLAGADREWSHPFLPLPPQGVGGWGRGVPRPGLRIADGGSRETSRQTTGCQGPGVLLGGAGGLATDHRIGRLHAGPTMGVRDQVTSGRPAVGRRASPLPVGGGTNRGGLRWNIASPGPEAYTSERAAEQTACGRCVSVVIHRAVVARTEKGSRRLAEWRGAPDLISRAARSKMAHTGRRLVE